MKIYIDDPLLHKLPDKLAVEFTKSKLVESNVEDWIECYRKFYPNANIYYKGV